MKKQLFVSAVVLSSMVLGATTSYAAAGASEGKPAKRDTAGQVVFEENDGPTVPVDPIDPEIPVLPIDPIDPEKPVEPGTDGPLSLDYASALNFGKQKITSQDKVYYAATQEVVIEGVHSQKPLYAQVTDGRGELAGWSLAVTQNGQFKTDAGVELKGAVIKFINGQEETVMESPAPSTVTSDVELVADGSASSLLMKAEKDEAAGTWIYRMGDLETMETSVQLHVPGKSTKLKEKYTTSLTWSLSTLPGTEVGE